MERLRETTERRRQRESREILTRLRDDELAWTQQAGCDETADVATVPGDDIDLASSIVEREMRASLDKRHQERLIAIDAAFERLQRAFTASVNSAGRKSRPSA
jgi:hypothetical protein